MENLRTRTFLMKHGRRKTYDRGIEPATAMRACDRLSVRTDARSSESADSRRHRHCDNYRNRQTDDACSKAPIKRSHTNERFTAPILSNLYKKKIAFPSRLRYITRAATTHDQSIWYFGPRGDVSAVTCGELNGASVTRVSSVISPYRDAGKAARRRHGRAGADGHANRRLFRNKGADAARGLSQSAAAACSGPPATNGRSSMSQWIFSIQFMSLRSSQFQHLPECIPIYPLNGSRSVRCSSLVIAALCAALLALAAYTGVVLLTEHRAAKPCLSETCVQTDGPRLCAAPYRAGCVLDELEQLTHCNLTHIASRILSALNTSVEPCDDFYEFACGGWVASNPVPEWSTSWDQLAVLRERLVADLRDLLEAPDEPHLPASVLKAKALFRTCVDEKKLEAEGVAPIETLLESLGLPRHAPAQASGAKWEEVAGRGRRALGLSALLSVHVAEDVRNTSRNRVVLEQVSPGFSERYLLHPEQFSHEVGEYRKYIAAMLARADPAANGTVADAFADDIFNFSMKLAKCVTVAVAHFSLYHPTPPLSTRPPSIKYSVRTEEAGSALAAPMGL
ncbi:Neprilysin-1 [Eumeta japonica]|uniref:Neprilysin-1 n=1 Tax=Eumeta variegata TaxID=151549 RepID=A0A4C1SPN9_EUMVA|nr:Neprilysin-1 [Eumeta japonica]